MSDLVIYFTLAVSLLTLILLGLMLLQGKKRSASDEDEDDDNQDKQGTRRVRPVAPTRLNDDGPRRRQIRQNRIPIRSSNNTNDDEDDDVDDDDDLGDVIDLPEGKIGAKKRRKLEMKAERRAQRERELQEREEKKERLAKLEEQRRKEEEKIKKEEKQKEEEERKIKEEKERQELEEYLKLKESFAVEEEGFDENVDENESENKLQTFIDYIKSQKVVLMEELAGRFQMKTQDVIHRVQELLNQELLLGVIDDRGKFIYITRDELESVAKFIKQRGRVSISELVENSNLLINLIPDSSIST